MARINWNSMIEAGVTEDDAYDYISNHGGTARLEREAEELEDARRTGELYDTLPAWRVDYGY